MHERNHSFIGVGARRAVPKGFFLTTKAQKNHKKEENIPELFLMSLCLRG
jgi:hypothetical protein